MTTKRFCALSFVVLFAFAMFTSGGCGSSSSDSAGSDSPATSTEIPPITDIIDTPEYEQAFDDAVNELVSEGVDVDNFAHKIRCVFIVSGDRAYIDDDFDNNSLSADAASVRDAAALPEQEITRIAEELKPGYESGDIIALFLPSETTINTLYEALGEESSYYSGLSASFDEGTYPEIYAIAKRTVGDAVHYFSYEVPGSRTLLLHEVGITSKDIEIIESRDTASASSHEDDYDYDAEKVSGADDSSFRQEYLYQARRYANFIKWAFLLDKRAAELEAETLQAKSALVRASDAETTSGNFINLNAEHLYKDFSRFYPDYKFGDQERYKHNIVYDSGVSLTVYSCHNFTDGVDYYLVKQNAFTTPKNYWTGTNGNWEVCHMGQTSSFWVRTEIKGADANSAYIIQNAPATVNYKGSVTDGMSFTVGSKIGADMGSPNTAAKYELSASLTYQHSKTWETTEWRLYNHCENVAAKWNADFSRNDGEYLPDNDNGRIAQASKSRTDIDSEWIWRVDKSYWKDHSRTPLKITTSTSTGCTLWEHHWYKGNESESYQVEWENDQYLAMKRPPHVWVSQSAFDFDQKGGSSSSFTMLCNSDYEIKSNQPWCQISPQQMTGSDTGANEKIIMFNVDAFDTESSAFETREAKIAVRENSTGDTKTITITQRNK